MKVKHLILIVFLLQTTFYSFSQADKLVSDKIKIDSLWTIKTSSSRTQSRLGKLKSYGQTTEGKIIYLNDLKTDNWPNDLIVFYNVLIDSGDKIVLISEHPVSADPRYDFTSKHYFDSNGNTFAIEISKKFPLNVWTFQTDTEYYDKDMKIIKTVNETVNSKRKRISGSSKSSTKWVFEKYRTSFEYLSKKRFE